MLNISKKDTGKTLEIRLSGVVDESSDFTQLIGMPPYTEFHVYSGSVSRINSAGVKKWRSYFISLRDNGRKLAFFEVSPALMAQANTMRQFIERDEIRSFVATYVCGSCEFVASPVFTPEDLKLAGNQPPAVLCSKCGKPMEFDDVPEEYFSLWLSEA